MSEWQEREIQQLKLQKLREEQGARMRAEVSRLGPVVFFLIRLCILLTINGAALSALIWTVEITCSIFNLHPIIPYSIAHLMGATHSIAVPRDDFVYSTGSSVMSNVFGVPPSWGGYTALSYALGWLQVGLLFSVIIPLGIALTVYHTIIGAHPVDFTKAIGLASAFTVGSGLFFINIWLGIGLIAMIVAPLVQATINFMLRKSDSGSRIGYWQSVTLILTLVLLRKRLSALTLRSS